MNSSTRPDHARPPLHRGATLRRIGHPVLVVFLAAAPLHAQEAPGPRARADWEAPEARALVERVAARRADPTNSGPDGYSAVAEGHIHFFLDRGDGGDPVPLRVDQVSLDLHWGPPDRFRQEVRAYRRKELLPIRDFGYYLDRFTVVPDGFGDWIHVGQGRDVRAVPHPLSQEFTDRYRYRLGDSVVVRFPAAADPVRIQEVLVRPVDGDRPGFVGSLYLDPDRAALVRMEFTFTPSSYVDRRVERIHVALHRGLWEGRDWLPDRQELEVRRRLPELDLGVSSVIRSRLRVSDYRLGAVDDSLVAGAPLAVPADGVGDTSRFRSGLMDAMADEGLQPWDPGRLEGARKEAMRAAASRGLPPVRPWAPGISGVVRANRAEGWYLGAGVVAELDHRASLRSTIAYRWGPSRPALASELRWGAASPVTLRVYLDEARDLGPGPTAAGAVNTLGLLLSGTDWRDLFYARGAEMSVGAIGLVGQSVTAGLRVEGHRSARLTWGGGDGRSLRPVRPVDEGTSAEVWVEVEEAGGRSTAGLGIEHGLSLEAGALADARWGRAHGRVRTAYRDPALREVVAIELRAGAAAGSVPPQRWFLLGGRGTLPGFAYRGFVGRGFLLASVEGRIELLPGWLTLRGLGAVGTTWRAPAPPPPGWEGVGGIAGTRGSLGMGLGVAGDALRLDLAHGLGSGGRWEFVVSVDPRLRPFL